jgi:hypothetical protein
MSQSLKLEIHREIITEALNAELPEEITDPQGYIRNINTHLESLLTHIAEIPSTMPWDVVTPERFEESTRRLSAPAKMGAFWLDMTNQALIYGGLSAWKWQSMASSLVRSINSRELIAPSLISRSMMELSTTVLVHVREALGVFKAVADSDTPVLAEPEQGRRIEETLHKALWGTRIGSSKLSDKTPLWSKSPYPEGSVEASNVLTGFQKLARDIPEGAVGFKVYEWLCDLVHPATQGIRVYWESYEEIVRIPAIVTGRSDLV